MKVVDLIGERTKKKNGVERSSEEIQMKFEKSAGNSASDTLSGETDRTNLIIPKFPFSVSRWHHLCGLIKYFRCLLSFLFSLSFCIELVAMATDAERVKPTKPDEAAYKIALAEAEKLHTAAQEKLVCLLQSFGYWEVPSDNGLDDPDPLRVALVSIIYLYITGR
jgi:hypothetical protein